MLPYFHHSQFLLQGTEFCNVCKNIFSKRLLTLCESCRSEKTNVATWILAHIVIYQTLHTGCTLTGKHFKTKVKSQVHAVHIYFINCMFCSIGIKMSFNVKTAKDLQTTSFMEVKYLLKSQCGLKTCKQIQSQTKKCNLQSWKKTNKKEKQKLI